MDSLTRYIEPLRLTPSDQAWLDAALAEIQPHMCHRAGIFEITTQTIKTLAPDKLEEVEAYRKSFPTMGLFGWRPISHFLLVLVRCARALYPYMPLNKACRRLSREGAIMGMESPMIRLLRRLGRRWRRRWRCGPLCRRHPEHSERGTHRRGRRPRRRRRLPRNIRNRQGSPHLCR